MDAALALRGDAQTSKAWRLGSWFAGAWRRLGWRQVALAALLSLLAGVLAPNGGVVFLSEGFRVTNLIGDLLAGRWVWAILPLVFAAMVADEAYADGVHPALAYGGALLLGSFAAACLDALGASLLGSRWPAWVESVSNTNRVKFLLAQSTLVMAVYGYLRTTQHALDRVRRFETGFVRDRQQLLSARLLALQARVEPQFLFDALTRIGALHEHDPTTADAMLADLIALLRAMLPTGTAPTSTVEREFALASAWLRVQRHLGVPIEIEIEASPLAARSALGPMLVLPLLQEMLALPRARSVAWRLDAEPVASTEAMPRTPRLRIRLAPEIPEAPAGSVGAATAPPARLRERLAELHGDAATLAMHALPEGLASFVLELPLAQEIAASDERPDR